MTLDIQPWNCFTFPLLCWRRLISITATQLRRPIDCLHTETHMYRPLQNTLEIDVSHGENNLSISFFYVCKSNNLKKPWHLAATYCKMKQKQCWSTVAERMLLSFKIPLCSSRVTHVPEAPFDSCYWCHQPRKAHHMPHNACVSSCTYIFGSVHLKCICFFLIFLILKGSLDWFFVLTGNRCQKCGWKKVHTA